MNDSDGKLIQLIFGWFTVFWMFFNGIGILFVPKRWHKLARGEKGLEFVETNAGQFLYRFLGAAITGSAIFVAVQLIRGNY